jgi:hypothetical protein
LRCDAVAQRKGPRCGCHVGGSHIFVGCAQLCDCGDFGGITLIMQDILQLGVVEKRDFRYMQYSSVSDRGKVEGPRGEMAGALTKTLARH